MDPTETLATIRRLAAIYRNGGEWDESETNALVAHIEDLDSWIVHGGFLPMEWQR